MRISGFSAVCLFVLLAGSPAQAGVIYAGDLPGFIAATTGPVLVETFDGIAEGSLPSPLAFEKFNATADNELYGVTTEEPDRWLSTNIGTDILQLTFIVDYIMGAGGYFFPTDFGGLVVPGDVRVTFLGADPGTWTLTNPDPTVFLGYIAGAPITGITIEALTQEQDPGGFGQFPTVNDLNHTVPEPGAMALVGLGLVVLSGLLRRRRT